VPVLPVGGEGLREALRAVGGELVASADDEPAAVVQGFAAELRYADLAEAALAVARGAWWVATNADLTLPTDRGLLPGNGALVGAVATAAGRGPDAVAGKPERALLAEALRRTGATCPLMVGDRFDTDIEGAVRGGVDSLWVSTGVASGADLVRAPGVARRP
jgi:ribonucleotide monophosphatase NagD (HAD superfamily)